MYFGGSIALIALGAILSFAVQDSISGVDLVMVGYILMAAGALGIVLSLVAANSARSRTTRRDDLPPR
ncbi:hypothetical protein ASD11_10000 [Aeromicrobium sp. Root495]|uniref:DUF6458 family protein n=1 Tax=Aeromicrobium sp. Root495 TaxID=1736550 RepID=UPI0006F84283|nr:DUF6458 family protein [Aeromicrobium sp. Root495]KQY59847.1 hypothetical protein ASD11_10000 [Aeromicrobium sp. Root495]RYJ02515.1 MAG: hypothetical protein EON52_19455 [Actinomycetales bacterium]